MVGHAVSKAEEERERDFRVRMDLNRRTRRMVALAAEREAAEAHKQDGRDRLF